MFDLAGQGIQAAGGWMQRAAKEANGGPTVEMTPQQRALYERRYGKQPPKSEPPKAEPKGKKTLPENRYLDRERTGITRMGGVTYDLSIPHHRELYEAASKQNQDAIPDNQKGDPRGGGGLGVDGKTHERHLKHPLVPVLMLPQKTSKVGKVAS